MTIFDAGTGTPIVVVPGLPGRWEWMLPALVDLAQDARVLAYSLCGERGSGFDLDDTASFDTHVAQLDALFESAGLPQAALCGVSLGGLIALRYAAQRPSRVSALILCSAPGPRFAPDRRQQRYLRAPLLLSPAFALSSRRSLKAEIAAALPRRAERWKFMRQQLSRIMRAPTSPRSMARRVATAVNQDFVGDCHQVHVPTLIVTGEAHLDRVVPVESTREYLRLIERSRAAIVPDTGHLGIVTRPRAWARTVGEFARAAGAAEAAR